MREMRAEQPLVTIVLIAYNEEKYLAEAISSALNQSYKNIEIILVDDGSTDRTLEVANEFKDHLKIISQENSGNCSFPRNRGLKEAKGKYISFLDADDILLPHKVESQVAILEENVTAGMVVSDYCNFKDEVVFPGHFSTCPILRSRFLEESGETICFPPQHALDILLEENFSIASSPLFKTECIKSLGGFSEELYACEDFHLNYRMALKYPIVASNQVVFHRRLHGANMSSNSFKMDKYYYKSRLSLLRLEVNESRQEKLKKFSRNHYKNYLKHAINQFSVRDLYELVKGFKSLFL